MKKQISLLKTLVFLLSAVSGIYAGQDSVSQNTKLRDLQSKFLSRLFSIQTSEIMHSMDIALYLGGSFGFEGDAGLLGTVALGLGGYGNLEVGTAALMGSIFNNDQGFGNVLLKISVFGSDENFSLALGLRTNNNWDDVTTGSEEIRLASEQLYYDGLRNVDYEYRITSLFLVAGTQINNFKLYGNISVSDLRYRNVNVMYNYGMNVFYAAKKQKKTIWNVSAGLEKPLNSQTSLIAELQTIPFMDVNPLNGELSPSSITAGSLGLRFLILSWLIIDSGIVYQSNYTGLSDAQIKIGLNGIWSVGGK